MSGGAIKKLRKAKIKEGMKNNKATKILSEALVDGKDPKTISAFISALFSKEG